MDGRFPLRLRTLVGVFGLVALVVGVNAIHPLGAIDPRVPKLACRSSQSGPATYGDWFRCSAGGGGGKAIRWPDGFVSGTQARRTPAFVGDGTIDLVDDDDQVLASFAVRIEPDIRVECTDRDSDPKKIFELAASDLTSTGWDYVFIDIETGDKVFPGDPSHPNGGPLDGLERVELGEAQSTGLCRIHSQAGEDLDGAYSLAVESPWEASQSTPMRIIGPSSKTQWAGTQPAEVIGTVTINDVTASERQGVYQSGCS